MIITFSPDYQPIQTPELDVLSTINEISIAHYRMTWKHDSPIGNLVPSITWARGRRVRFTIETRDAWAYGSRVAHSGRHMRKASWEAHRDVMRALFRLDPDAVIRTALATYRGADDFERQYERTGNKNVGSQARPRTMRECTV